MKTHKVVKHFILFLLITFLLINTANSEYIFAMNPGETITLRQGDVWDLSEGYTLSLQDVDLNGQQAWFTLKLDGTAICDLIVIISETGNCGTTYEYFSLYLIEAQKDVSPKTATISDAYLYLYPVETATTIATVAPSSYGTLGIFSSPDGASIYLDGNYQGYTSSPDWFWIYNVPVGYHEIKLIKSGYNDLIRTVLVGSGGDTIYVSETLTIQTGSISISSYPSDAKIYLDGTYQGITPYTIQNLEIGSYTIKITKSGYNDISKTITVNAGQTALVSETLNSETGSIKIDSNSGSVGVYLDDTYKGTTPINLNDIPIGTHTIKLSKSGYNDIVKTVTVSTGKTTSVSETLTEQIGSIEINSEPSGASVYLDDTYKGTTPITIKNIPTGSHEFKLTKFGYNDISRKVIVSANKAEKFSEDLTLSSIFSIGGISLLLLAIVAMVVILKRKKSSNSPKGSSIEPTVPLAATTAILEKPKSKGIVDIKSAFQYKGAIIQYKVKIINLTNDAISDIKIQLFVPDVFMLSKKEKSISMLESKEGKTVTFDIRSCP